MFFRASADLFQKLGIQDMDAFKEQTVDVNKKEVVDLLKFSLISRTPMTNFILKKEQYPDKITPNQYQFELREEPSDVGRQMVAKVHLRKSNGKVVSAKA
ncbi:hypothetical protein JHK87_050704 [Glycine soja]|nr:hypothetical protein JHK87_050704 [Glycine soja]